MPESQRAAAPYPSIYDMQSAEKNGKIDTIESTLDGTVSPSFKEEPENEKRLSEIVLANVKLQWDKIQHEEQVSEQKENDDIQCKALNKEIDRKNKLLEALMANFDHCNNQFQSASVSHTSYVDKLLAMLDQRLVEIENDDEEKWDKMTRECEKDQQELHNQHETISQRLQSEIFKAKKHKNVAVIENLNRHEQKVQETNSKQKNEFNAVRGVIESKKEDLAQHNKAKETKYGLELELMTDDLGVVKRVHQTLNNEIDVMQRKLDRLQATLSRWTAKVTAGKTSNELKARQLVDDKKEIFLKVKSMKRIIQCTRNDERKRLLQLATDASRTKKYMEGRLSRAQRILKRLQFIEQLEKAQESVAFFFPSKLDDDITRQLEDLKIRSDEESSEMCLMKICNNENNFDDSECWTHMMKFWKKHNSVALEIEIIGGEHDKLREENKALKREVQEYQDGGTILHEIIIGKNPKLGLNGRVSSICIKGDC